MALEKLDGALFFARIGCYVICCLALVMYIGNGSIILYTAIRSSLAALALQITVSAIELGLEAPLPNRLGLSVLVVVMEGVSTLVILFVLTHLSRSLMCTLTLFPAGCMFCDGHGLGQRRDGRIQNLRWSLL